MYLRCHNGRVRVEEMFPSGHGGWAYQELFPETPEELWKIAKELDTVPVREIFESRGVEIPKSNPKPKSISLEDLEL